jgi:hypothetical protein
MVESAHVCKQRAVDQERRDREQAKVAIAHVDAKFTAHNGWRQHSEQSLPERRVNPYGLDVMQSRSVKKEAFFVCPRHDL